MQEIIVVYLPETDERHTGICVPGQEKVKFHQLVNQPWSSGALKADVRFRIWYSGDQLFVQYLVEEKHIRAVNTAVNEPVYEDSCVEFFISLDEGEHYYNFEFNCIGTCLAGYGSGRNDRKLIDKALIGRIATEAKIIRANDNLVKWELVVAIPFSFFGDAGLQPKRAMKYPANFYKCGDLLPEPHFLSWTPIHSAEPNFHQPQFFGSLVFES
jgi:hypothetical protein